MFDRFWCEFSIWLVKAAAGQAARKSSTAESGLVLKMPPEQKPITFADGSAARMADRQACQ